VSWRWLWREDELAPRLVQVRGFPRWRADLFLLDPTMTDGMMNDPRVSRPGARIDRRKHRGHWGKIAEPFALMVEMLLISSAGHVVKGLMRRGDHAAQTLISLPHMGRGRKNLGSCAPIGEILQGLPDLPPRDPVDLEGARDTT